MVEILEDTGCAHPYISGNVITLREKESLPVIDSEWRKLADLRLGSQTLDQVRGQLTCSRHV